MIIGQTWQALGIPAETCLLAYRGSIAHNMHVPGSDPNSIDDVDLIGIVLAPAKNYLGLGGWGSRGTKEIKNGKWDVVLYDIRKAFSMLLQGNPNIISLLWTLPEHRLYSDYAGDRILNNRHLFIGKHMYASFAGYASAQLQKMTSRDPAELREYLAVTAELKYRGAHPNHKGEVISYPEGYEYRSGEAGNALLTSTEKLLARLRHFQKKGENIGYMGDKRKHLVLDIGFDGKNAAHCIRLLRMCKELLLTGEMNVYRTDDAAELLDIKKGKWPLEKVKTHAEELFAQVKAARDQSTLPEEPARNEAEALLVSILRYHVCASPVL